MDIDITLIYTNCGSIKGVPQDSCPSKVRLDTGFVSFDIDITRSMLQEVVHLLKDKASIYCYKGRSGCDESLSYGVMQNQKLFLSNNMYYVGKSSIQTIKDASNRRIGCLFGGEVYVLALIDRKKIILVRESLLR
jgi:hypothetical protein